MDFSKLSSSEKMAVYASVIVVVTGFLSIAREWGILMFLPAIAGIAALLVLFAPQVMPNTRLPGSTGSLLAGLGAISVVIWVVVLIDNLRWVGDHIIHWDTFQFIIGLIAAAGLTWYGWQMVQAEGGSLRFGSAGGEAPAAPSEANSAPPAAASETSEPTTADDQTQP